MHHCNAKGLTKCQASKRQRLTGSPLSAVAFDWENADPSVGIMSGGAANWEITHIAGKRCKKAPNWLYRRIEATKGEADRIQQECDAYEFPDFDDIDDARDMERYESLDD